MPDGDAETRKRRIAASLDRLPTLSDAVLKLFSLNSEAEDYPTRLAELLQSEPSLAARTLQAANSAFSGPRQPVGTIPEAVVRLGGRRTGQLLKAMSLMNIFTPRTDGEYNLWRHAVQVAVATRVIAGASGQDLDSREAYLAGLFHDIGRFVMFEHVPQEVREIEERRLHTPSEILDLERAAYGYDHCEVGWRACQALSVPAGIGLLSKHHHSEKPTSGELSASQLRLLRTIQQADRLSWRLLGERDIMTLDPTERVVELTSVCAPWDWTPVRPQELSMLLDYIVTWSDNLLVALGVPGPRKGGTQQS